MEASPLLAALLVGQGLLACTLAPKQAERSVLRLDAAPLIELVRIEASASAREFNSWKVMEGDRVWRPIEARMLASSNYRDAPICKIS